MIRYDAEAKEAELRAESASWNTSDPQPARPGDVPLIDVGRWLETDGDEDELRRLGDKVRDASERVGFYRMTGDTAFPQTEMDSILRETRRFHTLLTDEEKRAIEMDRGDINCIGGVGYLGYGNRKLPTRDFGNENAAFLVKSDHNIRLLEDNLWPSEEVLPGFRKAVQRYAGIMTSLGKRLLPVYAAALDLDDPTTYFDDAFRTPFFRLRMTHYPPSSKAKHQGGRFFGIAPHVDTSFFTLLLTDGTPGLTIFSKERNEWITVPPSLAQEGAIIVNSGELLRQWSNDRFLSARHFVSNPSADRGDRYSVPFFFNAHSDHRMVCLPSCRGPGNPPKYPPFSYNESQGVVQGE